MIIAPERRSVHCKAAAADRFNSAEEFQDGLELARWSRQLIEGVTAAYEASLAQEIEQEAEVYSQPMRRGALPSLYTLMGIDPHSDIVLHDQMALEAALHIADMEPETPMIFSNSQSYGSAHKSRE